MLKIFTISILIVIIIFFSFLIYNSAKTKENEKNLISFKLEGKKYLLKKAETPSQWQQGLMYIKKPVDYDGMIFIFPDKDIRNFWNKNTFVDLDVYWLDDDKIVGKDFLPAITNSKNIVRITSPAPVNIVLEIIK
jgi:hypothetical protein